MRKQQRGMTLPEAVVSVAILGLLVAVALPALDRMIRRAALRGAALTVIEVLRIAQEDARLLDRERGVKFELFGGEWRYAVYEDGNRDGVRNKDIASGADRLIDGPHPLPRHPTFARIGLVDAIPDPDTGRPMPIGASAVQFGTSTICSFSVNGDGTPGSIYLTDGREDEAAMVRSSGNGGALRILYYGLDGVGWRLAR
jgi:prepilin-type N-terminal cleavage/methylation domain-containing protein